MRMNAERLMRMEANIMKVKLRTNVHNITRLDDGTFCYQEDLVWSKWIAEPNPKPNTFMPIVEKHFSDDLHTSDSRGECESSSNKPRDKKRI